MGSTRKDAAPLGVAAMRQRSEMVSRKYFAHEGIGGDRVADRARETGYPTHWRDVGVGLELGAPVAGISAPSATLALTFGG